MPTFVSHLLWGLVVYIARVHDIMKFWKFHNESLCPVSKYQRWGNRTVSTVNPLSTLGHQLTWLSHNNWLDAITTVSHPNALRVVLKCRTEWWSAQSGYSHAYVNLCSSLSMGSRSLTLCKRLAGTSLPTTCPCTSTSASKISPLQVKLSELRLEWGKCLLY
jgi:hypothetical protein